MKLLVPGVRYVSERDAGTHLDYRFVFLEGHAHAALHQLLIALLPGHALSFTEAGPDDCYLEARRTAHGFETKRGCHGAYGTWRASTIEETYRWLLSAAERVTDPSGELGALEYQKSLG
jgi:hypothetical protein